MTISDRKLRMLIHEVIKESVSDEWLESPPTYEELLGKWREEKGTQARYTRNTNPKVGDMARVRILPRSWPEQDGWRSDDVCTVVKVWHDGTSRSKTVTLHNPRLNLQMDFYAAGHNLEVIDGA